MPSREHRPATAVAVVVSLVLSAILVRTAWVCDEAYLTLRTIDNWIHGYGLRWNPLERVQAFSHPLWLLLVAAGYKTTGEPYYSVLVLSVLLTLAAVAVVVSRVARDTTAAVGAAALLLLSKAFVDYSTSGLEHPLTYLLMALFFAVYLEDRRDNRSSARSGFSRTAKLAWLTGLLAVTRIEAVLLLAPALAVAVHQDERGYRGSLLAALLPLAMWELFATFYYGFPLPNAAYAWASAAPPLPTRIGHGALYLLDSINLDPITVATLVATVAMSATGALSAARPLAAGIVLYVLAVFGMGGDAMSGRLLAAPFLCGAVAVSRLDFSEASIDLRVHALALIVLLGVMAPRHALLDSQSNVPLESERTGIVDARRLTSPATGLLDVIRRKVPPNAIAAEGGRAAREAHRTVVPSGGNLVPAAFFAGPTVHIIDREGDADPLLARLPPAESLLAGAALRDLPDGYEESVVSGVNRIAPQALAALYDRLNLITRGPLWSGRRLRDIVSINLMPGTAPSTSPAR